jgi:hypothetical protein
MKLSGTTKLHLIKFDMLKTTVKSKGSTLICPMTCSLNHHCCDHFDYGYIGGVYGEHVYDDYCQNSCYY